ncbi:uncharacterized protein LOC141799865 [Halichoeres trimaculatus]|uniref:uncharacterized protein LOC141799865 n=1 Tax=Halichoeres trimaculatus TaxID=147232 RepID=UPI003D9FAC1C
MRVCHSLIFFFLTLRDDGAAVFETDIGVRTGAGGGKITVVCTFTFSGSRKVFCRDDCEDKDILVETSGVSNQSGRYSVEYKEGSLTTSTLIYVSITDLRESDCGRYRCWLDRLWFVDSYETFELQVTDTPTISKLNWTLKPSTAATPSTPSSTAAPGPASLLYVRLGVVILIMVSSSAVLIFCTRKRRSQAEDPHVELDYVNVTEGHQVYEEVGEEQRRGRSPPEETS